MIAARRLACAVAATAALLAAGCGEDDRAAGTRLTVVATTTQAADLTRNVGGARVEVVGLLAPNADPHEYEVRPRDVQAMVDADLIVRSGGDLDEWLGDAIEGAGSDAHVQTLIDHVRTRPGDGEVDPHWWQNPRNAIASVAAIRDALAAADPDGAATYRANAERYSAQIQELDRAVAACMESIPAHRRKLVTTHDALGYYAERYDVEVLGAVIPALTTQGQPSAGETAELARTIRSEGVKAIFTESSVDAKVEQAIARETGATLGDALWADTLGPEGSDGATYLQSIAANTRALVDGFTGGAASCSLPGS